jgi:hypothetical protein
MKETNSFLVFRSRRMPAQQTVHLGCRDKRVWMKEKEEDEPMASWAILTIK